MPTVLRGHESNGGLKKNIVCGLPTQKNIVGKRALSLTNRQISGYAVTGAVFSKTAPMMALLERNYGHVTVAWS
jgi:hypothetical protein